MTPTTEDTEKTSEFLRVLRVSVTLYRLSCER